jgi:aspartate aminotransferase
MVTAFQDRRDLMVAGLNAIDGITCQNPKGAFYVFPNIGGACETVGAVEAYDSLPEDLKAKTSPSTLFQMFLLFTHHVATLDRKSFGQIGSEGKHFLRISIATGKDELEEGLERIASAVQDRDGFQTFLSSGKPLY